MMTEDECKKTIAWLQEVILKLEDRADHEAFQEHINKLKASANELQERLDALEKANA
jgi:hypothetical protein